MGRAKFNISKAGQKQEKSPNEPKAEKTAEFVPIPKDQNISISEAPVQEVAQSELQPFKEEPINDGIKSENKKESTPQKSKGRKAHTRKKVRRQKGNDDKPQTAEQAYKEYKKRKKIVFFLIIFFLAAILFFGLYNTFFKEEMTPTQAAIATNNYNSQMQNQKWDSGIQSYLYANLQTLLQPKFISSSAVKEFSVSDIFIERNQPVSDTMFLTFFDCSVKTNGSEEKVFCYIFISTEDNKMQAASDVSITSRQSFTATAEKTAKNPIIDFSEKDVDDEQSKSFQTVLDNFLTLGYNLHQDTSNIYKGNAPLSWHGTYEGISECNVYKNTNELGFNAKATYVVEEDNGFKYTNTCYLQVEKQDRDTWIIKQIM